MSHLPRPPLSRALYEEIRARIADGTYAAGAPLPSSRTLAAERGVSRATVTLVYEQLAADGFIDTRPGARSRVASGSVPPAGWQVPGAAATGGDCTAGARPPLSAIGQRITGLGLAPPAQAIGSDIDFVYGPLAGSDFPMRQWLQAVRAVERQRSPRLAYEDPRGNPQLRKALQAHLSRTRGLACSVEQILIVNGSQQALDLCARLLVDPGQSVLVEDPGYRMAHHAFAAYGAQLRWLPADEHGAITSQLPSQGGVRVVYVTPTHQFPLGGFLPISRRRELLGWAGEHRAWIIEDDYDSDYRYSVRPEPTLMALDTLGCVIHVGTFSKTLSPQLRLGYMVLPQALVPAFAGAKQLSDRHAATSAQRALALLLEDGSYDRHVRRIRRMQQQRRQALLQSLQTHLGSRVQICGAASGLHLVVWLNGLQASAETALVAAAQRQGVRVYPISPLYQPRAGEPAPARPCGLVMGYALLDPERIAQGVQRLAQAVQEVQAAS